MDRITKIAWNAFINYTEMLRRGRSISLTDKAKLMVVYFFYYLKHRSFFLLDHVDGEIGPNGVPQNPGYFVINRDREQKLNKLFDKLLGCLSKDSCFVKPLDGEECSQLVLFTPIPPREIAALITNACMWDDPDYIIDPNDPMDVGFIYPAENAEPVDEDTCKFITENKNI